MRDCRRGPAVARPVEKTGAAEVSEVTWLSGRHIAFALPLILTHLACGLVLFAGTSKPALVVFIISSAVQLFGITTGYHRLLAHRSFKTSRTFRLVLAVCGVLAGQNGPLWWVGHHRYHHRHADRDDDAHSPRHGLFWSHMGWLFSPLCVRVRRHLVTDLARCRELVLIERYSYAINLAYALSLYSCGRTWHAVDPDANGLQFVVWGTIISTVFAYHAIWSANSICHRYGSRRYPLPDASRNNFFVSLITFGDGWHHNHHFCPYSARHGFRWWELDLNFAVLKLLSRVGLVWDLKMPPGSVAARGPGRVPRVGVGAVGNWPDAAIVTNLAAAGQLFTAVVIVNRR